MTELFDIPVVNADGTETTLAEHRGKVAEMAGRDLPGRDLTPLFSRPGAAGLHAAREGVLDRLCQDGLLAEHAGRIVAALRAQAQLQQAREQAELVRQQRGQGHHQTGTRQAQDLRQHRHPGSPGHLVNLRQ